MIMLRDKKILSQGLLFATLAFAYIVTISIGMPPFMMQVVREGEPITKIVALIAFLSLFVVSAGIMGMLIFGKPIMLYVDGKKREGVALACYTIGSLVLITFLFLVIVVVYL